MRVTRSRAASRRVQTHRVSALLAGALLFAVAGVALVAQEGARPQPPAPAAERTLAATVSDARMAETVRRLVSFGPRMYGTPSNHDAAAWLVTAFKDAGLDVVMREDTPRMWYQPVSWEIRVGGVAAATGEVLETVWPGTGSPSSAGEGPVSIGASPGAVCLLSANPTPETAAGCAAVLFDGRPAASGWPGISRLRGTWSIPVFTVSPRETAPLRDRVASGERVPVSFALEAKTGTSPAHTVVATLPGRDRSKHTLFCAHGDSDSGGPGANDNASGVAIVLEIARTLAAAVKAGTIAQPAWDLRFASWGGEISSTREYAAAMSQDTSTLQAVVNFDQSGFGSWKEALYVEPDDVPVNTALVTLIRQIIADHLAVPGFPEHAASNRSQGGTDSYVFQNTRDPKATLYPSVTLYTSAWGSERQQPVTPGFPPINWYADEKPGMVTIDGDAFYHSVGDTAANTTNKEPHNMGWCARVGVLTALRLMAGQEAR